MQAVLDRTADSPGKEWTWLNLRLNLMPSELRTGRQNSFRRRCQDVLVAVEPLDLTSKGLNPR